MDGEIRMNKYQTAIRQYEQTRQAVRELKHRRNTLIKCCTKRNDGGFHGRICLKKAYVETDRACKEDGDYYSFAEILENGDYCESCIESYKLKRGKLYIAIQLHGDAKRRLSMLGKGLLADGESE